MIDEGREPGRSLWKTGENGPASTYLRWEMGHKALKLSNVARIERVDQRLNPEVGGVLEGSEDRVLELRRRADSLEASDRRSELEW